MKKKFILYTAIITSIISFYLIIGFFAKPPLQSNMRYTYSSISRTEEYINLNLLQSEIYTFLPKMSLLTRTNDDRNYPIIYKYSLENKTIECREIDGSSVGAYTLEIVNHFQIKKVIHSNPYIEVMYTCSEAVTLFSGYCILFLLGGGTISYILIKKKKN